MLILFTHHSKLMSIELIVRCYDVRNKCVAVDPSETIEDLMRKIKTLFNVDFEKDDLYLSDGRHVLENLVTIQDYGYKSYQTIYIEKRYR